MTICPTTLQIALKYLFAFRTSWTLSDKTLYYKLKPSPKLVFLYTQTFLLTGRNPPKYPQPLMAKGVALEQKESSCPAQLILAHGGFQIEEIENEQKSHNQGGGEAQ